MRLVIKICLLAVASLFPLLLHADSETLTVGSPITGITLTISDNSLTSLGYGQVDAYIDPYQGTLNGSSVVLFCVDPDHFDGSGAYNVNVSSGGTGSSTEQVVYHGLTPTQSQTLYQEEAWLAEQLLDTPVSDSGTRQEIQGAIWQLADPSLTFPGASGAFTTAVNTWEGDAAGQGTNIGFEILTDSACTTSSDCVKTRQEYLVLTPEPASVSLLGLSLLSLFAALRRKPPNRVELP